MRGTIAAIALTLITTPALSQESTSWFAETFKMWDEEYYSNKEIMKVSGAAQNYYGKPGPKGWKHGWCNDLVVWGMVQSGTFDTVKMDVGSLNTMRGRHFTDVYNVKVESWEKGQDPALDWTKIQVGTVVSFDWNGGHVNHEAADLGIDHTSMFMGLVKDKPGYGWFMGGNQNTVLQPKMYKLSAVTFVNKIVDEGYSDTRYFKGIDDGIIFQDNFQFWIPDGSTDNGMDMITDNVMGTKWQNGFYGENQFVGSTNYNDENYDLWQEYGLQVQKFSNGTDTYYVETDKELHVHAGFIVTQEYKDQFSSDIAYIVSDGVTYANNVKKRTRWANTTDADWKWKYKFIEKHYKKNTNPKLYAIYESHFAKILGEDHIQTQHIARGHRYVAAAAAVKAADTSNPIADKNLNTDAGQDALEAWADVVVDNVLDYGVAAEEYGIAKTMTIKMANIGSEYIQ